jgi:hypothetical protein
MATEWQTWRGPRWLQAWNLAILGGKGGLAMKEEELQRIEQQHLQESACARRAPPPPSQQQTIHYTELPEDASEGRIAGEWNFYRGEIGRLLAEGHEGRWVLIKGEEIIGIWDTEEEANQVRVQRFLMQDILIHQILTREPVLRGPTSVRLWRN